MWLFQTWSGIGGVDVEGPRFVGLALVLLLAVAVPLLFSRIPGVRIPVVVGEIAAGIAVGTSGLNLVPAEDPFLDLLAEIGLVILMFLAGLEIDIRALGLGQRMTRASERAEDSMTPLRLGLMYFLLTLALTMATAWGMWAVGWIASPTFLGLVLATVSLGVVMPVLKERGLLGSRYGQTLLIAALVADFVTMILITLQVAVLSKGITFEILLVGLLFLFLFALYRLGVLVLPGVRPLLEELSNTTTQIHVRLAFLLLVTFVALAEILGAEIILGAFLAGLLISMLIQGEEHPVKHQLESMGYGFFIPVFFIMVGVRFNLKAFSVAPEIGLLLVVITLAAFGTKIVPGLVFARAFSLREGLAGGALLSAQLSLTVAAAEIGFDLGLLDEAMVMVLILMAVVTVMVAPMLFSWWMPASAMQQTRPVIVVGGHALGMQIARHLRGHGMSVVLLDEDAKRVQAARKQGFEAHPVRPVPSALSPYLDGAHTVIVAVTDPAQTLEWARLARQIFGVERVLALGADAATRVQLQRMGVLCVSPLEAQATFIALMARNPDLLHLLTSTQDNQDILELVIRNPSLDGKRLRDLGLPPHVLVLAVHRGGEYLIPRGATQVRVGDVLTVLGTLEELEEVKARLGAR